MRLADRFASDGVQYLAGDDTFDGLRVRILCEANRRQPNQQSGNATATSSPR